MKREKIHQQRLTKSRLLEKKTEIDFKIFITNLHTDSFLRETVFCIHNYVP